MPRPLKLNLNAVGRSGSNVSCLFSPISNSSNTILTAHPLGDGRRPRCTRCKRGGADCYWIGDSHVTPPPQQSPRQQIEFTSTQNPRLALRNPQVANTFRHYIDELAGWYDLHDSRRHFKDVVPVRARSNPLLLSAILAFAAAHRHRTLEQQEYLDMAEFYHYDSVRRLICLTRNVDELPIGESLAAICLLRSYEIITQNVNSQSHLQGCYSILASRHIILTTDLLTAGFWNYLREDITASLIERRSLMIDLLSQEISPPSVEDMKGDEDELNHGNLITFLLGNVINRCLSIDSPALNIEEWETMRAELENWETSLPPSFEPIHTPELKDESSFPPLWAIQEWHVSSLQYYHTAMSILWLAEPLESLNTFQRLNNMNALRSRLDRHATEVCALAISSNSAPVWVNAFGPIAFCGPWLQDSNKRKEITEELQRRAKTTGWPVSTIVDALGTPSA